jgi:hypothetical protein
MRKIFPDAAGVRVALSLFALLVASTPGLRAQDEADPSNQGEFSAHGVGVERVEVEAKIRVPLEERDSLWAWLQQRYAAPSWLDREGLEFRATFGDEDFVDVYFDTPTLPLLAAQSGVRHRSRVVHSGSAARKDGRQLLQLKLNRHEEGGLGRTEIKFNVDPSPTVRTPDDGHPMIGLVKEDQRPDLFAAFAQIGVPPHDMRPILTVRQNRKRVYLSDQHGAYATLTLDDCTVDDWGVDAHWVEIELELNEIRFTEADSTERAQMARVVAAIQEDLQAAFPSLEQDQTPKYNKAFAFIEAGTWLPVRTLIRAGSDADSFTGQLAALGLMVAGVFGFGVYKLTTRRNGMTDKRTRR